MPNEGRLAERKRNIATNQGQDRGAGRNERPENPNIGKPFKRYIGGDEVQKRAQNFSMFSRPPVVAPPPTGPGGGTGAPTGYTRNPSGTLPPGDPRILNPMAAMSRLPQFSGPGDNPSTVPAPTQNPGINPNQMYSPMSSGPGGILPQAPIPAPTGIKGSVMGGGGMFGQMPQVMGAMRPGLAQPMPQVPQRPMQYSLANRGWGPNSR